MDLDRLPPEARDAVKAVPIVFWRCLNPDHKHVEWEGKMGRCPDCGLTTEMTSRFAVDLLTYADQPSRAHLWPGRTPVEVPPLGRQVEFETLREFETWLWGHPESLIITWNWWRPDPDNPHHDTEDDSSRLTITGVTLTEAGSLWTATVTVTDDDERAVRAWLDPHARRLGALWWPLQVVADE